MLTLTEALCVGLKVSGRPSAWVAISRWLIGSNPFRADSSTKNRSIRAIRGWATISRDSSMRSS